MEGAAKKSRWEDSDTATAARPLPGHATPGMTTPLAPGLSKTGFSGTTPRQSLWDSGTPRAFDAGNATPATPGQGRQNRWGQTPSATTPAMGGLKTFDQGTPNFGVRRAWDATPTGSVAIGQTPLAGAAGMFPATPTANVGVSGETPLPGGYGTKLMPPPTLLMDAKTAAVHAEMKKRNRYMMDEEIDAVVPAGFEIVPPPNGYEPLRNPDTNPNSEHYQNIDYDAIIQAGSAAVKGRYNIPESLGEGMPALEPDDAEVFEILIKYSGGNEPQTKLEQHNYNIMKALLKVKNGTVEQRRQGMKQLLEKARSYGSALIFKNIFAVWTSEVLNMAQRHAFVKLIDRLLFTLGEFVVPQTKDILQGISPLLSDNDVYTRHEGREVIATLARTVGITPILRELKQDVEDENEHIRVLTAKILSVVAQALGIEKMLKFLKAACGANLSWLARHTGIKTIYEASILMGFAVSKYLPELISCIAPCIRDAHPRVNADTGFAIAALAEAVAPVGIEHFSPIIGPIREECLHSRGKTLAAYIRAIGSIVPLMQAADASQWTTDLLKIVEKHFSTPEEELKRILVKVVQQCVKSDGINITFLREAIVKSFFANFWVRRMSLDRKNYLPLMYTTVALAKKVGSNVVLEHLIPEMKDTNEAFQRMLLITVKEIVEECGTANLYARTEASLVEAAIQAIEADENGHSRSVYEGVAAVFNSLEGRLRQYVSQLIPLLRARMSHAKEEVRAQGANIFASIATAIAKVVDPSTMEQLGAGVWEKIEAENNNHALSAELRALLALLKLVQPGRFKPSLDELTQKIGLMLRNPDPVVQERCIEIVELIARQAGEKRAVGEPPVMTQIVRLHHLAMEQLFSLLDAPRRGTRRATIVAFGEIANTVQPFTVIGKLLDHFRKDARRERICAEVAVAAIADRCHPHVVVPFLINEYFTCEFTEVAQHVQRGVLKSLRFLFEYVGPKGRHCAYAVMPLMERALTESDLQTRRMAAEFARSLILAVAGYGYEDCAIHILNLIHPNIVELLHGNSSHVAEDQERMLTSVVEVFEAARLMVSPGVLLKYLVQGLFHPARKVRDIYWKIYNCLYLACGDQWAAFYPVIHPWNGCATARGRESSESAEKLGAIRAAEKYRHHDLDYLL